MVPADFDERMKVLGPHLFEGVPLTEAARAAGVPRRTATRWLAAYRAEGSAGLSRSARSDRGGHRMPAELHDLIEGLALRRPPPRVAEVHRAVSAVAVEHGWPVPCYEVVRRIVRSLEPGLLALAHHDPDVYRDGFELVCCAGSRCIPTTCGSPTTPCAHLVADSFPGADADEVPTGHCTGSISSR